MFSTFRHKAGLITESFPPSVATYRVSWCIPSPLAGSLADGKSKTVAGAKRSISRALLAIEHANSIRRGSIAFCGRKAEQCLRGAAQCEEDVLNLMMPLAQRSELLRMVRESRQDAADYSRGAFEAAKLLTVWPV